MLKKLQTLAACLFGGIEFDNDGESLKPPLLNRIMMTFILLRNWNEWTPDVEEDDGA
jgi:hypothetical protein